MKRFFIILLPIIFASACRQEADRADVYGNFESDIIYLPAETSGKLVFINTAEGKLVEKGQEIALVDTSQLYLQKKQLKAKSEALKNRLQNIPVQLGALLERKRILNQEIQRTKSLLADSAATQKQLDDLTGEYNVIQHQIDATKSQLSDANQSVLAELESLDWQVRQLNDQIQKSLITSPIKGTVLEKFKEAAEFVMPGIPILKLADLDEMTLRGFVSGDQLSEITIGQQVTVYVDSSDGEMISYPGEISWIASEAEFTPKVIQTREQRVNLVYAIKCRVSNDGSIKIGMPGEIKFQ